MKPPEFEYVRPASLDDAIAALRSGEEAKVLAGGQSLVPLLNMRLVRPRLLVDVARIKELRGVARVNGTLRIGATATQRETERLIGGRGRMPAARAGARLRRTPADPQPRHDRRQPGARRSGSRAARGRPPPRRRRARPRRRRRAGDPGRGVLPLAPDHGARAGRGAHGRRAAGLRAGRRLGLHGDHAPSRRLSAVRGGMPGRARRRRRVHGRPRSACTGWPTGRSGRSPSRIGSAASGPSRASSRRPRRPRPRTSRAAATCTRRRSTGGTSRR